MNSEERILRDMRSVLDKMRDYLNNQAGMSTTEIARKVINDSSDLLDLLEELWRIREVLWYAHD